jgi:hypothetical protein
MLLVSAMPGSLSVRRKSLARPSRAARGRYRCAETGQAAGVLAEEVFEEPLPLLPAEDPDLADESPFDESEAGLALTELLEEERLSVR